MTASRPAPYLDFRTMEANGMVDVREGLVAGDTVNDSRRARGRVPGSSSAC